MLEKIEQFSRKDPLFFHKVGLVAGVGLGVLAGLIISERADRFIEVTERLEAQDGETEED